MYVLEVQRFYPNGHLLHPEWNGKSDSLGYMNKFFHTKKEAARYYDSYNPNLPYFHTSARWKSDVDPKTFLWFVVRPWFGEYLKIPPFESSEYKEWESKLPPIN